MKSIRELYKIGRGPSSSHTMGPERAMRRFLEAYPNADGYQVVLYGSLALTGKGHMTDVAIRDSVKGAPCEILFDKETKTLPHENTMDVLAFKDGKRIAAERYLSVGGGEILRVGDTPHEADELYREKSFAQIAAYCKKRSMRLSEYVYAHEDGSFRDFLRTVLRAMHEEIRCGLSASGILPGGLSVERVAGLLYGKEVANETPEARENRIVCAYAFAAAEHNAASGTVVTAPTCGACAVLPAVLRYAEEKHAYPEERMLDALAVAGLIGCLVKENASISGAECGCQAEIGTACAMASAALCELRERSIDEIEYAAEMSLEHMLGLTCDPVCGLVQIPCIERNAVAAMRAQSAASLAAFLVGTRKVSFDTVVKTMYETGKDLHVSYRETAEGGLAKRYTEKKTLH